MVTVGNMDLWENAPARHPLTGSEYDIPFRGVTALTTVGLVVLHGKFVLIFVAGSRHAMMVPPRSLGCVQRLGGGGQPGAGRGPVFAVIFRKSGTRPGFLARLRMVSATASRRPLKRPMAARRGRVMFSEPWPDRMRLRSSSKLQSRM